MNKDFGFFTRQMSSCLKDFVETQIHFAQEKNFTSLLQGTTFSPTCWFHRRVQRGLLFYYTAIVLRFAELFLIEMSVCCSTLEFTKGTSQQICPSSEEELFWYVASFH
jgi:hypothetical protein